MVYYYNLDLINMLECIENDIKFFDKHFISNIKMTIKK